MSYSGTVRCSHCYEPGHNKLSCPKRRKEALANPESYIGRQWHREQENRKQQIANRVCSYCKEPNHNRRGCKVLKEDRKLIKARQQDYLKDFAAAASEVGLGVGTLLKVPKARSHEEGGAFVRGTIEMVTGIHWHQLDFLLQDTDMSRAWRGRDRRVLETRVVSTFGYDEDDSGWNAPPRHNQKSDIRVGMLLKSLSKVLWTPTEDNERDRAFAESCVIVAPTRAKLIAPDNEDVNLTFELKSSFHLDPAKNADEWDRMRVRMDSDNWSKVRPADWLAARSTDDPDKKHRGW